MTSDKIIAYTDGSSFRDEGGWAFTLKWRDRTESKYGYLPTATNQVAELVAVLRVLQFVKLGTAQPLDIRTDSQYVILCLELNIKGWIENGWRTASGKPVANQEYVKPAYELLLKHKEHRHITFTKVVGHSGNTGNNHVDRLAGKARIEKKTNWHEDRDMKL